MDSETINWGWSAPGGNRVLGEAGVHRAHDGRAADRVAPLAKSQRVADHAAVLGGDAAKGGDGAGEVVGLALDRHHPPVLKLDPSRIVLEGGDDQGMVDVGGRLAQALQQPQALPRGVIAVVAPGLRQYLNFRVGRGRPAHARGPESLASVIAERTRSVREKAPPVRHRSGPEVRSLPPDPESHSAEVY